MPFNSTITSKGQTTIPAPIRDFLHARPGTTLYYIPMGDGSIRLYTKHFTIDDLHNLLPKKSYKPVTIEEMNQSMGDAIVGDHLRYLRQP